MGFLQDFGLDDFIKDVMAVSEEIDSFKKEVVSSVMDAGAEIKSTMADTEAEITTSGQKAMDIVKRSTDVKSD